MMKADTKWEKGGEEGGGEDGSGGVGATEISRRILQLQLVQQTGENILKFSSAC